MIGTAHAAGAVAAAAFVLPALGFALGPVFEQHDVPLAGRRPGRRLHRRHLRPETITIVAGHRRGRQDDRLRAQAQPGDRHRQPEDQYDAVHRDLHALHAPRLPGPLRRRRRSASSARATAASTTSAAWSPAARRCARSTASTRASRNGQVAARPALLGQLASSTASRPRDPGEPLDGIGQYLYPSRSSMPQARTGSRSHAEAQAPRPAAPAGLKPPPAAPRRRATARRRRSTTPPRPASPSSTGSTSAPRCRGGAALADVPQGPEGDQLVLHARLGDDVRLPLQAVTGVFLAMYYDPSPTRRLRVDPLHHQRGLPRRVRARHAQVGLVGDGDPRLPAHGPGRSSSAPTSTRAS